MSDTVFRNYIAGEWVDGNSKNIDNISPADTNDIIGTYAQADKSQTLAAIEAAKQGQLEWEKSGLEQRYSVLMAIGDELIARKDELGELLAREEGKTLAEGAGETYRSGQFFHYYAAEVLRQMGETADSVRPGVEIETRREPVGVVGIITPWNFPTATGAWKIAPALAYGNAVVWKPANQVPASAWSLMEIISRQNLPAGTVNLVMGPGSEVGDTLIHSPDINALTFTGSLETGRKVAVATAENLIKCQLEMGSKNALIVLDDADLDNAVECAVGGAYGGTGQKCTASSRLIVTEGIHDLFVSKMIERMQKLVVGHPLKEGVHIGAVADARQMQQNLDYLALAKEEGGELVYGGAVLTEETEGYYMQPALFVNTTNQMTINREEAFAPIACIIKVKDYTEALTTLNDTNFGLTGGICTTSLKYANDFKRHAKTGCVMINLPTAGTDYHVPFGGRKDSSFGPREQGTYAKEFYTVVKTTYMRA
ncbi:aldehyde dehydrogenase family protein [Marinomonas algicola]|uniref:aldehyde dehydrogenase family protein n=1 Tax=Marinomonas algicola TaxID=2773454 RepID=UPI00174D8C4A|nr:aldehyde dehydrogenase family protein [Marinomonas algicola]